MCPIIPTDPKQRPASLSDALFSPQTSQDRFIEDAEKHLTFSALLQGSVLCGRGDELLGRSVLLATKGQLTTAAALIELDGVARRIVLCPPELPTSHFPFIIAEAEIDCVVSDRDVSDLNTDGPIYFSPCTQNMEARNPRQQPQYPTEWVLLTSGTTGLPKLVVHTLSSLCAAIQPKREICSHIVWSTFYDMRRYGGLQIFLRAMLTGGSLVLSGHDEPLVDFLYRAGSSGVTHISGTPSHWRCALLSSAVQHLNPHYVRLSGETVDQAILNRLRDTYPKARIVHAFASTEAGVAFEVNDGFHGFPADVLTGTPGTATKIENGTLRVRSAGAATRYLGTDAPPIADEYGFVDTKDIVDLRDGRYFFSGRRDGVINVGGLKVFPEEVESVINRHPDVIMCLVRARRSPITGSVIVADVVLKCPYFAAELDTSRAQNAILNFCRERLPSHKVPAVVSIVPMLLMSGAGKLIRRNA